MYQIPELLEFPKLKHAISTVDEGNMANWILGAERDKNKVLENKKKFFSKAEIDIKNCLCMRVVHGSNVLVADKKNTGVSMIDYTKAAVGDGVVTNEKGLYLFLMAADCLPIIFYDPKGVVGLVHAGRRGAELNIVSKATKRLREQYKTRPRDLMVGFGPAARVPEYFKDFVGECRKQLLDCGILQSRLFDCGINTMTDKRFFSHRKDANEGKKDAGRFACVVGLS